jgi:hypothetical protein
MKTRVAAVALALAGTGCASIVQGSDQRVAFETQPPGATVRADMQTCTTPCSLRLRRNRNLEARIRKAGYEPETVYIRYELDPWILGNLVFLPFAPIGGAVDIVTGAGFRLYPPFVVLPLRESAAPAPGTAPTPRAEPRGAPGAKPEAAPPGEGEDEDGDWKALPEPESI